MKNRRFVLGIVLFVLLAPLLGACGSQAAPAPSASTGASPAAKEPYKIGVTAAMTGPMAVTFGPWPTGLRIYVQRLNDSGGIDGHPIQITNEDDRGDGARAGSIVKKFAEEGVSLILNMSGSPTYAASVAQAKSANIPIIFVGIPPTEASPPSPERLVFAASYGSTQTYVPGDLYNLKALAPNVTKLGAMSTDTPVARMGLEVSSKTGKEQLGIDVIPMAVPAATPDLTSVASAFVDAKVQATFFTGPGALGQALFDAMKKLGWSGPALQHSADPIETILDRMKKDPNFMLTDDQVPLPFNLPEHKEIVAAAKKYDVADADVNSALIRGWQTGKLVETILKRTGWPANTDKLVSLMSNNFEFDRTPVTYKIKWSANDHVGPVTTNVIYWDQKKNELAAVYMANSSDGSTKPQKVDRMQ